jgi:hypothetical protein
MRRFGRKRTIVCIVAVATLLSAVAPAGALAPSNQGSATAVTGDAVGATQVDGQRQVNLTYGVAGRDEGPFGAVATADGYVIGSRVRYENSGRTTDGLVTGLARDGTVEYERLIDTHPTLLVTGEGIARAHGEGVVVGGTSQSFIIAGDEERRGRLVAVDADGDVRWEHTYRNGTDVYDVARLEDGGYVVVGWWSDPDAADDEDGSEAWVAEVDADGDVEWERTLAAADESVAEYTSFSAVTPTDDGGIVAVGGAGSIFGVRNTYSVRFDDAGTVQWTGTYNQTMADTPLDVAATESGFVVAGYGRTGLDDAESTVTAGTVLGLDTDGEVRYSTRFDDRTVMTDAVTAVDGGEGVLVAGADGPNDDTLDASVVLSLDASGDRRWSDRPGGARGVEVVNATPTTYTLVAQEAAPGADAAVPPRDVFVTRVPVSNDTGDGVTEAPPALSGSGPTSERATDPDGDGLYEDVNGDGSFTIVDVATLLRSFDGSVAAQHTAAFDFKSDGRLTILDVVELLQEL